MSEIFSRAPIWVWGVLITLVVVGLLLTRDRRRAAWIAILPSSGFAFYSAWGAYATFPSPAVSVAAWLIGASVPLLMIRRSLGTALGVLRHRPGQIVPIAGSFVPLVLFVSIFCVRYALNVLKAVRPEMLTQVAVAMMLAGLLGLLSGALASRAMRDIAHSGG